VLHTSNGGTNPIEVYARRVEFEETDAVQWILRDVTARKELDSLRDDMTAMIYHDLRSPLGNIISSLEMLRDMVPEDESIRSMLAIAENSTARIQRLINSLLDINRLESGQPVADQKARDPEELIQEAIRNVEPGAIGRHQTIKKKVGKNLPPIWVDVDMIQRVLINLMENAIKFTPTEGTVEVGAEPDGVFVKMWVRDNGPGIALSDQDRIFEKFTRLRGKDKPGGLGVGLAFCRLAIQGHGGQIWVESEPDHGATFWITLPIAIKKRTGRLKRATGELGIKQTK
jgi:signal transduction histidine kinase